LLEAIWGSAARFATDVDVGVTVADGGFPDLNMTDVLARGVRLEVTCVLEGFTYEVVPAYTVLVDVVVDVEFVDGDNFRNDEQ